MREFDYSSALLIYADFNSLCIHLNHCSNNSGGGYRVENGQGRTVYRSETIETVGSIATDGSRLYWSVWTEMSRRETWKSVIRCVDFEQKNRHEIEESQRTSKSGRFSR